jgi:predicted MFS family arabinose efflux permease
MHIDAGLIVNALAAVGALSAAVAAVWVATRDRRERL